VQASAQAMGNNAAISNQGGSADVVAVQDNRTYVRAQTQLSAYDFGGGAAVAYGAGNALQVGQNDVTANIDVTQVTNGGVEVIATFDGTQGYDGAASATAVGNAVVGYACSDCGANLTVNNSQTNLDGVSATSATRVAGAGRAVVSGATATGNSATFYVSRPSQ
ncbi:MAG TPA: holdfast anchor protein HfaD, partial [Caulobacteraceae bacterium]